MKDTKLNLLDNTTTDTTETFEEWERRFRLHTRLIQYAIVGLFLLTIGLFLGYGMEDDDRYGVIPCLPTWHRAGLPEHCHDPESVEVRRNA